jgi:O-antigen/teichoic acid export membrane protein
MNARKSVLTFLSQIMILGIGIASNKVIFTVLSPEDYGLFGYAVSSSALFFLFGDLQLQSVYFKRIAEGQDLRSHFSTYMFLKLPLTVLSVTAFIVYVAYEYYTTNSPDTRMLFVFFIVLLSCVADVYTGTLGVIFSARREASRSQLIAALTALFNFVYIITFVYATRSVYIFSLALLAKSFVGGAASYYFVKNEVSLFRLRYDPAIVRDYIHFIVPLLPVAILGTLYDKLDTVLVKNFVSISEAGYFAAAQKFNTLLLLPSASIMSILYSTFSQAAAEKDFTQVQNTSNKATKYVSLIVTMLSIYIFFNTRDFVVLFMSPEYLPTVPIIKIFMIQVILMSVSRTMDSITLAAERLKFLSLSASLTYVLGIGLNLVLIPRELFGIHMYGLQGAGPAMKSLVIYVVSIAINAIYLYSQLNITVYWRFMYHLAGAICAGYLVGLAIPSNGASVVLMLPVKFSCYVAVYAGCMAACGEIRADDIRYLRGVFNFRVAVS